MNDLGGPVTDYFNDEGPDQREPWCGCGEPDRVAAAMVEYLTPDEHGMLTVGDSFDRLLLAYMADSVGWTEHGTTIRFAWLLDAGKRARARLLNDPDNLPATASTTPDSA